MNGEGHTFLEFFWHAMKGKAINRGKSMVMIIRTSQAVIIRDGEPRQSLAFFGNDFFIFSFRNFRFFRLLLFSSFFKRKEKMDSRRIKIGARL